MIRRLLIAMILAALSGCQHTAFQAAIEKCAATRNATHVVGAVGKDSRVEITCFSPEEARR